MSERFRIEGSMLKTDYVRANGAHNRIIDEWNVESGAALDGLPKDKFPLGLILGPATCTCLDCGESWSEGADYPEFPETCR